MSTGDFPDRASVRAHYGTPSEMSLAKELKRLDKHCRAFIALSPFVVLASSDAQGRCDATPRGDAPGFVTVLDDQTIAIPDRTGNKRVDTMLNVIENPRIGALFLVPGVSAVDPTAVFAMIGVLGAVALLASLPPAMRALRIDPMEALRYE